MGDGYKTRPVTDDDLILWSKYWFQKQPHHEAQSRHRGALMASIHPEGHIHVIFSEQFDILTWFTELDYPIGWHEAFVLTKTYDPKTEYVVIFHELKTADDGDYVRLIYRVISNEPLKAGDS